MQEVLPATLEFLGTFLIGIAVLRVHTTLGREHKIDKKVLKLIRKEKFVTILGLILITLGYIIHVF